jgi:hypothetical protein
MKRIRTLLCVALAGLLPVLTSAANYERLPVADGVLLLDWRGEFTPEQRAKLEAWLTTVGETATLAYGKLPRSEIRIALQPYPASSAVPFARVLRQAPEGVLFYINPDRPLDEFIADWTAYHELAHLFIPYPGMADIWFSEGLASYYQNVLQYRAGLLTAEQARQKLLNGFERGRQDNGNAELTLTELSDVMRERHAYMRVYWSGALYFLETDLTLRSMPADRGQPRSLDAVLGEYGGCCLQDGRQQSGREIAAEFDRIAGSELFVPLYDRYAASMELPDYGHFSESITPDTVLERDPRPADLTVQ